MIRSFEDADTEELFLTGRNRKFRAIEKTAQRKLDQLDKATMLDHLKVPPGNKLHALDKGRKGQHAIWINDQYRLCFTWKQEEAAKGKEAVPPQWHAYDVEVTDYH